MKPEIFTNVAFDMISCYSFTDFSGDRNSNAAPWFWGRPYIEEKVRGVFFFAFSENSKNVFIFPELFAFAKTGIFSHSDSRNKLFSAFSTARI